MTDIPDEAVEAATLAVYTNACGLTTLSEARSDARAALTAAAPLIRAAAWAEGWHTGYTDRHMGRVVDGYVEIDPTPCPYIAEGKKS